MIAYFQRAEFKRIHLHSYKPARIDNDEEASDPANGS